MGACMPQLYVSCRTVVGSGPERLWGMGYNLSVGAAGPDTEGHPRRPLLWAGVGCPVKISNR